jgi:spore coat polysaccharide biosynthesis predicted glycosyltransferase SpsG
MFALCIEASHARGMGHLYRALALAQALEAKGAAVSLLLNDWTPAVDVARDHGRNVEIVSLSDTQSGWERDVIDRLGVHVWVNDRLDTTAAHAAHVRSTSARLASIDDRGAGAAQADLNIVAFPANDDEKLPGRRVLSGVSYLVMDPDVARHRRQRQGNGSLVVSMGGSDTYGVTVDIVRALRERQRRAVVILGPGFAHDEALASALTDDFTVRRAVPSLVEEFAHHDLAITAGGVTPCEANAAGLPCIIVATEPWEARTGEVLSALGGSIYAGPRANIDMTVFDRELPIAAMSAAALAHVPADGAARVAEALRAL